LNCRSWRLPGERPEYLFWVGSAGAFDDRYKKVTREFVKILTHFGISYAVLGTEEADSGDVARRAGNEMLFQMQALMNIELFKMYEVKKILTCCPHDYNAFKNEYPDFGGQFEVIHHSQFLASLLENSKFQIPSASWRTKQIQNPKFKIHSTFNIQHSTLLSMILATSVVATANTTLHVRCSMLSALRLLR
jgi:Fe-S oxidoreductase